MLIKKIRSGGQSGVDRAALDTARKFSIPICGWVPEGGWAEDYPSPPGLLRDYPELVETGSENIDIRTEWNARDADGTLILFSDVETQSRGTLYTRMMVTKHSNSVLAVNIGEVEKVLPWLRSFGQPIELNVAGPRESESPGIYQAACTLLGELFSEEGVL